MKPRKETGFSEAQTQKQENPNTDSTRHDSNFKTFAFSEVRMGSNSKKMHAKQNQTYFIMWEMEKLLQKQNWCIQIREMERAT